ncbi:DUF58 domain-containing protein [Acetobacter sp. TBRC 12305]|uniref:DUF58 domain-containing protein n=2 Tax=Acetobacter garciniae TaxID=2817435 RepID=A0A939HIB3_9PROT|nr:DUF58 domain-containing protein [Acetobacter garciniae]MBX0343631.1 DUF58 domain-containing protein [Acetobacter garciniae]
MPDLLLRASRTAAALAAGLHPQRRAGWGDAFWQYRPAQPGEPATRIDWRQSARSTHAQVREMEAETAQTILLWCDLSPSLNWRSLPSLPTKGDSALVLLLAMAALLLRGGERVRLLGPAGVVPLPHGGTPLERLATGLLAQNAAPQADRPGSPTALMRIASLPRRAHILLASDFLCPQPDLDAALGHLASLPVKVHLLHVYDPAEASLPYTGRVLFTGLEDEPAVEFSEVQDVRGDYHSLIAARHTWLSRTAARHGHDLVRHQTDAPALPALLALHALMGHGASSYGAGGYGTSRPA